MIVVWLRILFRPCQAAKLLTGILMRIKNWFQAKALDNSFIFIPLALVNGNE